MVRPAIVGKANKALIYVSYGLTIIAFSMLYFKTTTLTDISRHPYYNIALYYVLYMLILAAVISLALEYYDFFKKTDRDKRKEGIVNIAVKTGLLVIAYAASIIQKENDIPVSLSMMLLIVIITTRVEEAKLFRVLFGISAAFVFKGDITK